jgi:hypothetical protein
MPHISVSIRDPDEVVKTVTHKIGSLTLVGMCLSFVIKLLEISKTSSGDHRCNCKN